MNYEVKGNFRVRSMPMKPYHKQSSYRKSEEPKKLVQGLSVSKKPELLSFMVGVGGNNGSSAAKGKKKTL